MYAAKASLVNQPVKVNVHSQRVVAMIAKLPNAFPFHVLESKQHKTQEQVLAGRETLGLRTDCSLSNVHTIQ